jgi:hypothetical protein
MVRFVLNNGFEKWLDGIDCVRPSFVLCDPMDPYRRLDESPKQPIEVRRRFDRRMYRWEDGSLEIFYQESPAWDDPVLERSKPQDRKAIGAKIAKALDDFKFGPFADRSFESTIRDLAHRLVRGEPA